jgi:hypothetical protein
MPILENKPEYLLLLWSERILSLSKPNFWPILGLVRSNVQTHRRRLRQRTFTLSWTLPFAKSGTP